MGHRLSGALAVALLATGCATRGDVARLEERVEELSVDLRTATQRIEELAQSMEMRAEASERQAKIAAQRSEAAALTAAAAAERAAASARRLDLRLRQKPQ